METSDNQKAIRKRLQAVLKQLRERGMTQKEIARCVHLAPQYLSDVKTGRKPVTALFALRLGSCYDFDSNWLMQGGKPPDLLGGSDLNSNLTLTLIELNVFHAPISGDTGSHPDWDGTQITLSGAAAVRADCANRPYVLRFGGQDLDKRLRQSDLILISQEANDQAAIHVVRHLQDLCLARKVGATKWRSLDHDRPMSLEAAPVGHCLGIVWGAL